MTDRMQLVTAVGALVLIALVAAPPAPAAQHEAVAQHQAGMMSKMMPGANQTDEIAVLTEEMNKATGDAKIDAMARLLTALARQHTTMMAHMRMMHGDQPASADTPHTGH